MIPVIRVYLRLGYIPCLYDEFQKRQWQYISKELDKPPSVSKWVELNKYLIG
jgi:hypothetical protein